MTRHVFDLDGTLCRTPGMDYARAVPASERIRRVNELHASGHHVTIDTGRAAEHRALTEAQLAEWGVRYHVLRVGEKPPADVYVDDRAVEVAEWFPAPSVKIAGREVGPGCPVLIVAEIGINHNGEVGTALRLIEAAAAAGADAVKFQVGDPRRYVSRAQWDVPRATPWGVLPYIEYRSRMELSGPDLRTTQAHAERHGLLWFASALDVSAVGRLEEMGVPAHKVASPRLTDEALLGALRETGKPVLLSTGMSTLEEIDHAVQVLGTDRLVILHCTSAYPCPAELANLRTIETLRRRYGVPVGYSGHEIGIPESVAAVALGACAIERHLTLSRASWGSDHAASLEPGGLEKLCKYVRTIETALGDGVKRVYAAEGVNAAKFRRAS
jgi:N-acetylneuraminate synthase